MAQKIFNLDKWIRIEEGSALHFTRNKPRNVAIDVNCPGDACFYVLIEDGDNGENKQYFLGLARGRDRFEFAVPGTFRLYVEEGDAFITSSDGEFVHAVVEDPKIFTKVANRRARNPHLEMMDFVMKQNQRAFMEQMNAEMDRREAAIGERYAAERPSRALAQKFISERAVERDKSWDDGPSEDVRTDEEEVSEGVTSGEGPKKRKPAPDTEQPRGASEKT